MAVPDPMPKGDDKPTSVTCEFCECKLTRRGQVIDISEKAKSLRRLQDGNDKHEAKLAEQAERITTLERELAEAKARIKDGGDDDDDENDDDDGYFKS
jgi:septal ring factor EnvC (AmiA/AmiB activator)